MIKILILALLPNLIFAKTDIQIVTNSHYCTDIGLKLFKQKATVPEVFIAVSACEGMVNPQDAGLGGGFQAVIYNSSCTKQPSYYLNARELSPQVWPEPRTKMDFHNGIAIPGVLKGYEYLYTRTECGYRPKLKWKSLFQDTIKLGQQGFNQSKTMLRAMSYLQIIGVPINRYFDIRGSMVQNPILSKTFKQISREGPSSSMYKKNGYFMRRIRNIVPELSVSDFTNYHVKVENVTKCQIEYPKKLTLLTTKLPGSGTCICAGMKILSNLYQAKHGKKISGLDRLAMQQQTLRYIYAIKPYLKRIHPQVIFSQVDAVTNQIKHNIKSRKRRFIMTTPKTFGKIKLGNFKFNSPYGTTNVVIRNKDVTLVATSTINYSFGSRLLVDGLGFFLNNQLYDFSYEQNHPNYPRPNARPQSSIAGTIVVNDKNQVRLAVGAAGGKKIIAAIFQTMAKSIFDKKNLNSAVNEPRCLPLHKLSCEFGIYNLTKKIDSISYNEESGYSAVTAIDLKHAVSDVRRGGKGVTLKF